MNRDEVIEQAKQKGLVVEPCRNPNFLAIRAYEATDLNERIRIGAGGELYTQSDDGWMYQVGTVEDVERAIREMK